MEDENIIEEIRELLESLDRDGAVAVRKAAEDRVDAINKARRQAKITEAWARVERCKPGTALYVHARYMHARYMLNPYDLYRGDRLVVCRVDKAAERIEVEHKRTKRTLVFGPRQVEDYELSRKKPKDGDPKAASKQGRRMARVLDEALS